MTGRRGHSAPPLLLLLLASCSFGTPAPSERHGAGSVANDAAAIADNVSDSMEPGWAYVAPDRVFDRGSAANALARPPFLAGAALAYFDDAAIRHQYSARQLATMRSDAAGFSVDRDLDGDGRNETYRTGYWRKPGPVPGGAARDGTFLAVFEGDRQRDVVDTTTDGGEGVFLSWHAGPLVVADCNCAFDQTVSYAHGKLRVVPAAP